jgi:uncharacterized protein YwlG (UPF0340 family)
MTPVELVDVDAGLDDADTFTGLTVGHAVIMKRGVVVTRTLRVMVEVCDCVPEIVPV